MLANQRKAYASRGDDNRTRFVKEPGRHKSGSKTMPMPADATGTRFVGRVLPPDRNILVSGHNNIKIGRAVRKGHLRDYHIFTLSLEERKTCPSSCQHWTTCYGNSMPLAKRVDHTHPDFLAQLEAAIERVLYVRGRRGVLIRLHALGDFFSTHYVAFWCAMLVKHPKLSIYGYTAHPGSSDIGWGIHEMNYSFPKQSMIRFSNGGLGSMDTVSIGSPESCPPHAFICPEQTGKTLGCDTCGACWATTKTVAFLEH